MANQKTKVISLQTKNNSFFIKPIRSKKIPNTMVTLFLGLQLIYGLNFGFIDILNKKKRTLCKCVSYIMTVVVTTLIILPFWLGIELDMVLFFHIVAIIQYVSHVIFLHFTKYKVLNFIKDMRIIREDRCLNDKCIGWVACLCLALTCVLKYVAAFYSCVVFRLSCVNDNVVAYMLYIASTSGLDAMYLVQIIIYYYIYNSVKYLKRLADDRRSDLNVIKAHFVFMADCCDKVETLYGNLVSVYV